MRAPASILCAGVRSQRRVERTHSTRRCAFVLVGLALSAAACASRVANEPAPSSHTVLSPDDYTPLRAWPPLPAAPEPEVTVAAPELSSAEIETLARASASAADRGRSEQALDDARTLRETASDALLQRDASLEEVRPLWALAAACFERWDDVFAEPPPPSQARYATAVWLFTRGSAYAADERLTETAAEYDRLRNVIRDPTLASRRLRNGTSAIDVLAIAERLLAADIARLRGLDDDELGYLYEAVRVQNAIVQQDAVTRYLAARRRLGASLLRTGQAREAEYAFREELARDPGNGWALYGLTLALREQGRDGEAADVERAFRAAWTGADVSPHLLLGIDTPRR